MKIACGMILTLLLASILFITLNEDLAVAGRPGVFGPFFRSIEIDSDFEDWLDVPYVVNDTGDFGRIYDFCEAYMANNETHLFVAMFKRPIGSFNIYAYLDIDQSSITGEIVNDIGADYKIDGWGGLHRWDSSTNNWVSVEADFEQAWLAIYIPNPNPPPTQILWREGMETQISSNVTGNPSFLDVVFRVSDSNDVAPNTGHITYSLSERLNATIDIGPDKLNLKSKGKWITAYIELPEGYDVSDIDISTVMLDRVIGAELHPTEIGDYDEDGIPDLMVKFDRTELISYIYSVLEIEYGDVTLTVSGQLGDGTVFEGMNAVRVIFAGDINGDGKVNVIDLSMLGRGYGSAIGEPSYHERADLNSDGTIDIEDIAITAINYGATTPE